MMTKTKLIVLFLTFLLFGITGCKKIDNAKLVGSWNCTVPNHPTPSDGGECIITFTENRFSCINTMYENTFWGNELEGGYEISGDTLLCTFDGHTNYPGYVGGVTKKFLISFSDNYSRMELEYECEIPDGGPYSHYNLIKN